MVSRLPHRRTTLSGDDLYGYRDWIMDMRQNEKLSVEGMRDRMREAGLEVSIKTLQHRIKNKWNAGPYQSSQEKEALCRQIFDANEAGVQIAPMESKQVDKLRRYCVEKRGQDVFYERVLTILSDVQLIPTGSTYDTSEDSASMIEWLHPDVNDIQGSDSQTIPSLSHLNLNETADFNDDQAAGSEAQIDPPSTESHRSDSLSGTYTTQLANRVIRQPLHFNSKFAAMQQVCDMSQQYYHYKLREYFLGNSVVDGHIWNTSVTPDSLIDPLAQNKVFWSKIKSGLYYLKIKNNSLAIIEWREAFEMISSICKYPSFNLIRHIFAFLSPAATKVSAEFRKQLLATFWRASRDVLEPNHILSQIFQFLNLEEGSDELSIFLLQALWEESRKVLPETHQELFDLQRTLIRLYRWKGEFEKAEGLVEPLITALEKVNPNHINTRLALSEHEYILKDQKKYHQALSIAEDVVERGKTFLGNSYPDERAIYDMEDVADIHDRLDNLDDSLRWLRQAEREAVRTWGHHTSTTHIIDKCWELQDKRYLRALAGKAS